MAIESKNGIEIDIDHYLANMSPEARIALVGLVESVGDLQGWFRKSRASGHGWPSFERNSREPDELLWNAMENAGVIRRDMAQSESLPELNHAWDDQRV